MEVAAGERSVLIGENDWIVGHRTGLDRQRARGVDEQIERGAHDLRLAAETVGVLYLAASAVAVENFAAFEQFRDCRGDADLARLSAQGGDARIERLGAA